MDMSGQPDLVERLRNAGDVDAPAHLEPLPALLIAAADEIVRLRTLADTHHEALSTLAGYAYVGAAHMGGGPTADVTDHTDDEQTCVRCVALAVFDRLDTGDLSDLVV